MVEVGRQHLLAGAEGVAWSWFERVWATGEPGPRSDIAGYLHPEHPALWRRWIDKAVADDDRYHMVLFGWHLHRTGDEATAARVWQPVLDAQDGMHVHRIAELLSSEPVGRTWWARVAAVPGGDHTGRTWADYAAVQVRLLDAVDDATAAVADLGGRFAAYVLVGRQVVVTTVGPPVDPQPLQQRLVRALEPVVARYPDVEWLLQIGDWTVSLDPRA